MQQISMDFGGLPWKSQASDEDLWTQVDVSAPSRLGSQGADITSRRMTTYSEDGDLRIQITSAMNLGKEDLVDLHPTIRTGNGPPPSNGGFNRSSQRFGE